MGCRMRADRAAEIATIQRRRRVPPRRAPATRAIVALTLAMSSGYWLLAVLLPDLGHVLRSWLWNEPRLVTERLWLWQVLSANLVHPGALHLAFNLFLVLWLGPALEGQLGSRRFAIFYLGAGVFAFSVYDLLAGLLPDWGPTAGASACAVAVVTLHVLCFPGRRIDLYGVLRVPLWWILLLLVVSDLSSLVWRDGLPQVNNCVHLAGVAFALLWRTLGPASPSQPRRAAVTRAGSSRYRSARPARCLRRS